MSSGNPAPLWLILIAIPLYPFYWVWKKLFS